MGTLLISALATACVLSAVEAFLFSLNKWRGLLGLALSTIFCLLLGSVLFIARVDGKIAGALTLATFRIPTGVRAWIEDVVVDSEARGHGVGEALNMAAIAEARSRGAITVELTSRPSREAANRLYQRIGFVQRETNIYRFTL